MKTNTKYLIGIVAIVLIIAVIAAFGMRDKQSDDVQTAATAAPTAQVGAGEVIQQIPPVNTNEPKVMPTFMYFVSKNDASYDAAKAVYDELAAEYGDKVKFQLMDVDEHPEYKDNYMINLEDSPILMHTPTLIMLDVHNNISTIGLSECTDKATLKAAIEKALAA